MGFCFTSARGLGEGTVIKDEGEVEAHDGVIGDEEQGPLVGDVVHAKEHGLEEPAIHGTGAAQKQQIGETNA